jgi:hypothetical protein
MAMRDATATDDQPEQAEAPEQDSRPRILIYLCADDPDKFQIHGLDDIALELLYLDTQEAVEWLLELNEELWPALCEKFGGDMPACLLFTIVWGLAQRVAGIRYGKYDAHLRKAGEKTVVTKHDEKGRIVEFEKKDVLQWNW